MTGPTNSKNTHPYGIYNEWVKGGCQPRKQLNQLTSTGTAEEVKVVLDRFPKKTYKIKKIF